MLEKEKDGLIMLEKDEKIEKLRYIVHLGYCDDYLFTSGLDALCFAKTAKISKTDTYKNLSISIKTVEELETED